MAGYVEAAVAHMTATAFRCSDFGWMPALDVSM
jgi:hypothetical protein